jgi:hypothetical protein
MGVEMKSQRQNPLYNEKGLASVEATVLVVLFISMIYYTFGFFGIVHTGVLHNIHARTYVFETFRHRTNLMYFRSNRGGALHYYETMTRLHGINTDSEDLPANQIATERPISMGMENEEDGRQQTVHNRDVYDRVPAGGRNQSVAVNPVWIMTMYGICLNSRCGG